MTCCFSSLPDFSHATRRIGGCNNYWQLTWRETEVCVCVYRSLYLCCCTVSINVKKFLVSPGYADEIVCCITHELA